MFRHFVRQERVPGNQRPPRHSRRQRRPSATRFGGALPLRRRMVDRFV